MSEPRTMIPDTFRQFWSEFAPICCLAIALAAAGCAFHGAPPAQANGGGSGLDAGGYVMDGGGYIGDFVLRNFDLVASEAPITGGDGGGTACSQVLQTVVRDFRGYPGPNGEPKHPDFEYQVADVKGIVAEMLGTDGKPVYAPPGPTTITNGPDAFNQWYRDTPDVNIRIESQITLVPHPTKAGTFVYDNDAYFPIDDMGFGNQFQSHNFHFTTEVHFDFPYRGGETFTFRGDDDLWLFVNGHLALDLGGVHAAETGMVDLDQQAAALGITTNHTYRMDIFQAERHTSASTFHIETTLQCLTSIIIP